MSLWNGCWEALCWHVLLSSVLYDAAGTGGFRVRYLPLYCPLRQVRTRQQAETYPRYSTGADFPTFNGNSLPYPTPTHHEPTSLPLSLVALERNAWQLSVSNLGRLICFYIS